MLRSKTKSPFTWLLVGCLLLVGCSETQTEEIPKIPPGNKSMSPPGATTKTGNDGNQRSNVVPVAPRRK
ncbi:MAG: hypothetical protein AAFN77_04490 [Planctomycetota bacterium]